MSTSMPLHAVLRAARRRDVADTFAAWLPLPLLAALLAWRLGNPALALAALVLGLLGLAAVAAWRVRRFDQAWLIGRLDQRRELEDSSDLLFTDPARLNPLQHLQRARLQQRLEAAPAPDLRAPWSTSRLAVLWLCGLLGAAVIGFWPTPRVVPRVLAPSDERVPAIPGVPRLVGQHLRIAPPPYTGLPVRDEASLDAKAPQGAGLQWTLRFEPQPAAATLHFHDGRRLALVRAGDTWSATTRLDKSALYRVMPQGGASRPAPRLHRLDAIADQPPQIKVLAPDRGLSLLSAGQRHWPLSFQASDDYGVAGTAQLRVTLAQGSGENITFREHLLKVAGTGSATSKRFDLRLDLAALGLAVGDDLIAQLSVDDNRRPQPQTTRSPSLILRWPSDLGNESTDLEGMVKKVLPAYFRSQRQIIIDAEALQKEKPRLGPEPFLQRADAIGVDQRLLRLRYGQFLGEEAEGEPKPPPTNDRDQGPGAEEGHEHASDTPAAEDGHAHEPTATTEDKGFGHQGDVLSEYGHTHDHAEAATLLDPETRATLKKALDQMWQSELHLRQGQPDQALPFAYRALGYIKEVQQASRIYLARVGPELPPIDENRRLSGDRSGLARRELHVAATDAADTMPAAAWQALQASPTAAAAATPDLDALQRWLGDNEARVADPLSLVAAIDALRGDPQCAACRQQLRALLWQALARPAAQVHRRQAADPAGARYLDALGEEAQR